MPQDYNIYIHSTGGGDTLSSKTTPFANQPIEDTEIMSFSSAAKEGFKQAQQFASGGFSGIVSTGAALLARKMPQIAVVLALTKIADSVVTTVSSWYEQYTGNFTYSMNYNNFKTMFNNVVNPVGLFMYNINRNLEFNRNNQKIEQQRTLIGNSYSSLGRRGV